MSIEEIRARERAATPGPWRALERDESYLVAGYDDSLFWDLEGLGLTWRNDADRVFIIHARSDIPELLARIDQLEERLRPTAEEIASELLRQGIDAVKAFSRYAVEISATPDEVHVDEVRFGRSG